MNKEAVLNMLAEILDVDLDELIENTPLEKYEEWDSLAKLTIMAEVKKQVGFRLTQDHIKTFHTIGDIVSFMEKL